MSKVQTTCPYCGVGCGVIATIDDNQQVTVQGDSTHPANYGRLCSKGAALADTLSLEGRLLYPEIRGTRCDWNTALDTISSAFQRIIAEHGKQAIAFYVSGQLLTEDYYVANKFMKGFIGTANIDTNSRLCMSSSVAGHQRAYGSDTVSNNYEDLEQADLLILVGSNLAWCHPVLFQRISAAKQQRPDLKIVVIDPRRTATCEIADVHLAIKSGTDVWFFNGLLNFLRSHDYLNYEFLENHTQGIAATLHAARQSSPSIPSVAQTCGLTEEQVVNLFRLFARTEKVITIYSQGVNQSSSGTDKVNSIINCHLATGRLGKVGMGAFSVTGQPNAMGGREVGALANQLAAHTGFSAEHRDLVQEFWQSPHIPSEPGLKAVDLFSAIADGKIKAIWIMATNPLVSLPNANAVKRALQHCELVIVSECVRHTDTTEYAHILLPAQAWGEKEGTVTNSERRISRQRIFLPTPGEAKPDWWIVSQIAQRMGYAKEFAYQSAADVFREHARLSAFKNEGTRDFDLSGLTQLSDTEYQELKPIQWAVYVDLPSTGSGNAGTARFFENGRFYTKSGKAQLVALSPRTPQNLTDADFPLILNTGRIRDQWHTMARTGKVARLLTHISEPYIEIHPHDAKVMAISEGNLVQVTSCLGNIIVRARVSAAQRQGHVFVPMHWHDQLASCARVGTLIAPATDPISGQPELKYTPVNIKVYQPTWQGLILSKDRLNYLRQAQATLELEHIDYWVEVRSEQCWRYELAGNTRPENWAEWAQYYFGGDAAADWLEYQDRASGYYRSAQMTANGGLYNCIFIGQYENLPSRDTLVSLFAKESLTSVERLGVLSGQNPTGASNKGETICACFNVGRNTLLNTIRQQQLTTTLEIAKVLKAGSNCGSCIPELKALLAEVNAKV